MPPPKTKSNLLSAGQKKLATLGLSMPILTLTSVGSFPKPTEIKEIKYRVQKGFQKVSELERKESMSVEYWIREQEKLGFDVLVDGEINRSDLVSFFAEKIRGFEMGGLVRCYGNRYYRKPVIKEKLEKKGSLIADSWRVFQRSTHKPLKAVLTGPYTLLDWSFNEFYSSRESALNDLTNIIRKEVEALSHIGAKIIQIDEPALSSRPDEFALIAEAFRKITHKIPSYFILHHCYGDIGPIWSKMQNLPVDNFDLDTTNSDFAILKLIMKHPTKKDLTLGFIDCHTHEVESPQAVYDRIKRVLKVLPASQLWVAPDCGLRTREYTEAQQKLVSLQKATLKAREGVIRRGRC